MPSFSRCLTCLAIAALVPSSAPLGADEVFEPLKTEMSHFLDVLAGRDEPLTPGRDGLKVVQVLERACASIREGGRPLDLVYDD